MTHSAITGSVFTFEDLALVLAKPLPQQKPLDPIVVEPVAKVPSLQQNRTIKSNVSDRIEQELASLGVKLNSTLSKVIRSAPESVVMNAIAALKEAITSGKIEHPGGWLKTAILPGDTS